jgi:hypothetical protein
MPWISRRTFFRSLAGGLCAALVLPRRLWSQALQRIPHVPLLAIGQSVLPAELGTEGKERIVEGFQQWVDDFRPEPELASGWGSAEIPHGPPDPTQRWIEQLEQLDGLAVQRHDIAFADLAGAERLTLLRNTITEDSLPLRSPAEARHVAVGLLAFFYRSPEATNLCYRAAIHSQSCRNLSAAREKPASLQFGA